MHVQWLPFNLAFSLSIFLLTNWTCFLAIFLYFWNILDNQSITSSSLTMHCYCLACFARLSSLNVKSWVNHCSWADGILNMVLLWNAWHLDVCELFETYICFSFSYFNGLTAGNETKMPATPPARLHQKAPDVGQVVLYRSKCVTLHPQMLATWTLMIHGQHLKAR